MVPYWITTVQWKKKFQMPTDFFFSSPKNVFFGLKSRNINYNSISCMTVNNINNTIITYTAFKILLNRHKPIYFKNYLHSAYFWSWENSPGLRLTHFSWLVILAARVLVKYQKYIPFDPGDINSIQICIFTSQWLESWCQSMWTKFLML